MLSAQDLEAKETGVAVIQLHIYIIICILYI